MKFKLRTLMGLVSVTCVLIVIALQIVEYRRKVKDWRLAFATLGQTAQLLGADMKSEVLTFHEMQSRDGTLAQTYYGSVGTDSSRTPIFAHEFEYRRLQAIDGKRLDGVRVTLDAVMNLDPLDDHVVHLRYESNSLNKRIAGWIEGRLTSIDHVSVEHHQLTTPVPSIRHSAHPANDGTGTDNDIEARPPPFDF